MHRHALRCLIAAALLAAPALADSPAAAAATAASPAVRTAAAPSPVRQAIVDRANRALTTAHLYKETRNGPVRLSKPGDSRNDNFLGGGNFNEYNGFNGDAWCGYFANAMWANSAAAPDNHKSSRAWETGVGGRFHAYRPGQPPQRGDVIVWHNHDSRAPRGHVAVVVAVGGSDGRSVTTIEGNAGRGSDSITMKTYRWVGAQGPKLPGRNNSTLKVRGFASRS
ncbi:CHAP domain-containing protein [Streptomyces sp. NPDC050997]|uniref:CHAP domain-containing protein n=1 Tax=Streptomyces sp. NPDC050997 TaxID=3155519 RepID=UPI00343C8841